jgi:hypothetical protein
VAELPKKFNKKVGKKTSLSTFYRLLKRHNFFENIKPKKINKKILKKNHIN